MMTMPDMAIVTGAAVVKVEWLPQKTMEQDPTQASVLESTDTEMYQVLEKDLLISNDYQAWLVRKCHPSP